MDQTSVNVIFRPISLTRTPIFSTSSRRLMVPLLSVSNTLKRYGIIFHPSKARSISWAESASFIRNKTASLSGIPHANEKLDTNVENSESCRSPSLLASFWSKRPMTSTYDSDLDGSWSYSASLTTLRMATLSSWRLITPSPDSSYLAKRVGISCSHMSSPSSLTILKLALELALAQTLPLSAAAVSVVSSRQWLDSIKLSVR
mmetsp:Transcript_4313/g.12167  ORF Transcript_4313/g.12167 Transcript_4313/m.12167 type:complete len:203 (-) Transcript_4313:973-1581(-)